MRGMWWLNFVQGRDSAEAVQASHPQLEALGVKQDSVSPMQPRDLECGQMSRQATTSSHCSPGPLLLCCCSSVQYRSAWLLELNLVPCPGLAERGGHWCRYIHDNLQSQACMCMDSLNTDTICSLVPLPRMHLVPSIHVCCGVILWFPPEPWFLH